MSSNVLFSDDFRVDQINPEGKKFEKVNRLVCKAAVYEIELLIDIHSEIYEVQKDDKLHIVVAKSLLLEGQTEADAASGKGSLLDQYDYAMHGVVYKHFHAGGSNVEVHVSHGGLLAQLVGDQRHLAKFEVDSQVYTLIRKL
ncbi:RNA polymerase [Pelagophyceae sp. CCMP2097]|nr:RNA polymerase [Pelagophyceae sp. CCMP2097]